MHTRHPAFTLAFVFRRRGSWPDTGVAVPDEPGVKLVGSIGVLFQTFDELDDFFAAARHVTKLDIINNRLVPNAIEPRAALAEYDAGTAISPNVTASLPEVL